MKECLKCGIEKPNAEYYLSKTMKCGFQSTCKVCSKARQKVILDRNRESARKCSDPVDWKRVTVYLKSCRVPYRGRTQAEILILWNEHTDLYVPRESDKEKYLKSMKLMEEK